MNNTVRLRKAYTYIIKETVYFRRALLLRPLTQAGTEKEYTVLGMVFNIITLLLSTVASSTCYRTLSVLRMSSFTKEKGIFLYLCIGKMSPFFLLMMGVGGMVYYLLFGYSPLEAGYIVIYSLSATLPISLVGKSAQLLFKENAEIIGGGVLLISGAVSSIFVLANRSQKIKGYFVYSLVISICILIQTVMHIFSDTSTFGVFDIKRVQVY